MLIMTNTNIQKKICKIPYKSEQISACIPDFKGKIKIQNQDNWWAQSLQLELAVENI